MTVRVQSLDSGVIMQVALNVVNLLFLCYLIVYAVACPTPALVSAVVLEFAFYILLLCYRFWKSKQPKSVEQVQIETLHDEWKSLAHLRKAYRLSVISLAAVASAYFAVDWTALFCADCGNLSRACDIYRFISLPPGPSLHPGLSMELLAGAYIESNQLRRAEPIFLSVAQLRKSMVGERHELIADIDANLADLYSKIGENDKAESYYMQSIELAKELRLPQGFGSPMTKLGSLYTKERRFGEAEAAFKQALAIRTRLFGSRSEKVAETQLAYSHLLRVSGQSKAAADLENLQVRNSNDQPKSFVSSTLLPVSISMASVFVLWKRDKLFLVAANLVKQSRGR
jgi:Tetratricopeptide repeat